MLVPHQITITRKAKPSSTNPSDEKPTAAASLNGTGSKRKRILEEIEEKQDHHTKRGKVQKNLTNDDLVIVDDSCNGAIVIEDN